MLQLQEDCPQNAMMCTERKVDSGVISEMRRKKFVAKPGVLKSEGKDILLDTGCSRTLVR